VTAALGVLATLPPENVVRKDGGARYPQCALSGTVEKQH
jgi:hypothetical protein